MAERERAWTPGPWQTAANHNGIRSIVERAPGDRICSAFFRGEIEGSAAKAEANAALIKAAPDLYEALEELVNWIEGSDFDDGSEVSCPVSAIAPDTERARAALAKAEPQTLSPQEPAK